VRVAVSQSDRSAGSDGAPGRLTAKLSPMGSTHRVRGREAVVALSPSLTVPMVATMPWPHLDRSPLDDEGTIVCTTTDLSPFHLADAYAQAARRLTDSIVNRRSFGLSNHDLIPLVYIWRHAFELILKDWHEEFRRRGDLATDAPTTHSLGRLWRGFVPHIPKLGGYEPDDLARVADILDLLDQPDPSGETFRYTRDRGGQPLIRLPPHVSIETLSKVRRAA
jgi:hypothetical protein